MGLTKRFETFVQTMPGFESIDALLRGVPRDNKPRADYLFWDRTVIVEQKALIADPSDKPQQFVDKLISQGRALVYGRSTTRVIFDRIPDGKALEEQMLLGMTNNLEKKVAIADEQTSETRKRFSIPEALGILVLLNESAVTLSTDLIHYRLNQAFQKKDDHGGPMYPHNDGVILISHAAVTTTLFGPGGMPCVRMASTHCRSPELFSKFSDALIAAWALFCGLPLCHT